MVSKTYKSKVIDRRIVFVEKYIKFHFNGTIAYKEVFGNNLSDNTAAVNSSRLLRNAHIQEYLKERLAVLELDSNYVLMKLKNLAENSKSDVTKLQAIIAIGKTLRMFSENTIVDPEVERSNRNAYLSDYIKTKMFNSSYSKPKELS